MTENERDHAEALDNISPNLKLSGSHVVPVLRRIREAQPVREDVQDEVMKQFPDKSAKSVFRGMVMPTTTRLKFVRSVARKETVFLSPNGEAIVSDLRSPKEVARTCLRDYATLEVELRAEDLEWLEQNENKLRDERPRLAAKATRFNTQFLNHFSVDLPATDQVPSGDLKTLYANEEVVHYLTEPDPRRDLIQDTLPPSQMVQMERARWLLMRALLKRGHITSTWFIDALLWRERRSEGTVVDLWEASTQSDTKLMHSGTAYDAVIVRGKDP